MAKTSLYGSLIVIGALFVACNSGGEDTTSGSAAAPTSAPATTTAAPPTTTPPSPVASPVAAAPTGQPITVTRVIDGDTFDTSDGRRIRVLGIDSCELGTYGGDQAKTAAEGQLTNTYNQPITITSQPGVDTDKNGRQLRYVQLGSGGYDFGEFMVKYDHTGVYQGKNDASPDYVARLYAADTEYSTKPPSGRECGNPYPEPTPASDAPGPSYSIDDDDNMPDGALTGGFCRRHWWC